MDFDIARIIRDIALLAPPILIAITFHELAHGLVADRLGDPTARLAGRLTINPIKHLDPIGTLVFVFTRMIGWAKPVPVNPYNLKDPKRDMIWISLAGPAANMIIAVISAIVFKMLSVITVSPDSIFGEKVFIPLAIMVQLCVVLNIGLAVFNLLPIPPLDGSKILMGLLPYRQAVAYSRLEPYGFLILIALIFFRITDYIIFPIIILLRNLLLGG
ncbi:MAG TPA: site-2 protease family protein [Nitrospiraceae bacterium]|nr:site-2 protease family protein [Nitrospiraceae bacterium]